MLYDSSVTLIRQWNDCTAFYIPCGDASPERMEHLYRLATPLCLTYDGVCLSLAAENSSAHALTSFFEDAKRCRKETVSVITVCGDDMRHGDFGVRLLMTCAEEKLRFLSVSEHRVSAVILPDGGEIFRLLYLGLKEHLA